MTQENSALPAAVRCRMAPSPTGPLHFGTARTTLVNWLFARHSGGVFILRLEDTDKERSKPEYEKEIIEGLRWLGIEWDEGPDIGGPYKPYRQSERGDTYEPYLKQLLEKNQAYYCYCTKDELEAEKKLQTARGGAPKYSGRCRMAPPADREPQVIRFKMPEREISFDDIIHGKISFDLTLAGDVVIARNIREPLYNFAVVVDDFEMKITHVIRGDDHIANTPKQIAFGEALGFTVPQFAHMPIILNPDRSKMSKRFTETSLLGYRGAGYLPEALINFISFLGWHPKDASEVLSKDELIEKFELARMQKAGAVFDEKKLNWLNSQYLKNTPTEALIEMLRPFLAEKNIEVRHEFLQKVIDLEKGRAETLAGLLADAGFFFHLGEYDGTLLVWKNGTSEKTKKNLGRLLELLEATTENNFVSSKLEEAIMPVAEVAGRGDFLWPFRVAVSGLPVSPGPFEIAGVLGKLETMKRVKSAIKKL